MTSAGPMPLLPTRRPGGERFGVLFVCLGNICRSPMAEAIFLHRARERGVLGGLDVDSCGLGDWHVGGPADPRTIAACRRRGVAVPSIARLWDPTADPARFDVIIPMDAQNVRGLAGRGAPRERIRKMRLFEAEGVPTGGDALFPGGEAIPDVPDPYTGPDSGFDELFHMLDRSCGRLLEHVERVL